MERIIRRSISLPRKMQRTTALRLEPNREEARLALARYYYHGLSDYRRTEQELSRIPFSAAS